MEREPLFEIKDDLIKKGYDLSNLTVSQDILKDYQDSMWYGGVVASINYKGANISICAYGDVICTLFKKNPEEIIDYVKDKTNAGSFYCKFSSILKGDGDLVDAIFGDHPEFDLEVHCGNWWEAVGFFNGEYFELGLIEDEDAQSVIMSALDSLDEYYDYMTEKEKEYEDDLDAGYSCMDCQMVVEPLDIPLCEDCQQSYDLDKFWIKHDFELGNWHEPHDFNENPTIREKYRKDDTIIQDISEDEILKFREMLKDKYLSYSDGISCATISQILNEVEESTR